MTIGSILLGLAMLVLVGLFIARPLIKPESRSKQELTLRQALLTQKEALLIQIKNLDFDYETGKMPEADYRQQRDGLMVEATAVLKQLDALDEGEISADPALEPEMVASTSDTEAAIEAAIAARRTKPAPTSPTPAEIEPPSNNGKSNFCPQCGQSTDPDDKFCANCGHKLLQPQRA